MPEIMEMLSEISRLMQLKGENQFKIRAFDKAIETLNDRTDLKERAQAGTLTELPGIGKGIEAVLIDYLLHGRTTARDQLRDSLPVGLIELTSVPGLGPKKALSLIEGLGIHSVAELEYACRENRLLKLKGFGAKIQQKILEGILFQNSNAGLQKYSEVEALVSQFLEQLRATFPGVKISETGLLRRKLETLSSLEFLIEKKKDQVSSTQIQNWIEQFRAKHPGTLPIQFLLSTSQQWGYDLAKSTGSSLHWKTLGDPHAFSAETEEAFYEHLNLPWIPPEMRETGEEVHLARAGDLSRVLSWNGIRGVFHNHTTRSDGAHSLEQMVSAAEKLGYEYIGISDHSQTAFYAQGLKVDDLDAQEKEIREVQERHPGIRVFWGIESDILADGSLDYDSDTLKRFDFVIASVHSRFQMDQKAMTQRILTAIRNPYTRFIGHVTGRLLLGRHGYDLEMEAVLKEAAQHDVAVELNSNPARLDIDWRWGSSMRRENTLTSINPDAHEMAGLSDIRHGITMARKGLLLTDQVINSRSPEKVEKWLKRS